MKYLFGKLFRDATKDGTKIPTGEYHEEGRHPIIDQGKSLIAGYTDEEKGIYRDVPAIIFGDHTRIVKYCDEPFFLGEDGTKLLKVRDGIRANPKYLYYYVKAQRIPDTGYNRHFKWLKETIYDVPDLSQQNRIAGILDAFEDAIKNRQRVLTLLDELVRSRFVEMFGDPVKNPYRWPKKLLTDLGDCKNGMNFHRDDEGYEIHCLGVGDFQNLSVISDAEKLPLISLDTVPSQEYLLQDEDVVFVRSNGNKKLVGRCVAVYPKDVPTTFSGFCIRFRKNNKIEIQTKYLLQVLKSDGVKMQMEGRGANIQNLNQKILSQVEIPIPPLSLQTQFATFVHQVDATKSSVQSQLDSLMTLRAKMMQDFFG